MKSKNPFSPGGIVPASLFGGRDKYILEILSKLSSVKEGRPHSFYLFGERGIGKTALAKLARFISEANDKNFFELDFLTSYYSAQPKQTFKSILEASLNNLADQMEQSALEKVGQRLGKLFENGKFSIGAFGIGFEAELNKNKELTNEAIFVKDQFVSIAKNILKEIKTEESKSNSKKRKSGLFIVIDEIDNVVDIQFAASIIRGITTSLDFDELGFISFMFIGYVDGLKKFIEGDESVRRLIDCIQLREMSNNEVVEVFEKGFKAAEVRWNIEALNKNADITGGYPLAIQVIGSHLIKNDSDENVDTQDWEVSIEDAAKELIDKEFASYYTFRKKEKKNSDKILLALAVAKEHQMGLSRQVKISLTAKELEQVCEIKNARQYITELEKVGIISLDENSPKTNRYLMKRGLLRISILLDLSVLYGLEEAINKVAQIKEKINKLAYS